MKATLVLISLLLVLHCSQAQTNVYQPYPLANASWTIKTLDGNAGPPIIEEWHTKTWGGQIVIGGETYTEVFDDPNMVGVRQDIPNKKVFYIDDQGVEYDASFDQDVQVGDTVLLSEAFFILNTFPQGPANGFGQDGSVVIESIDSVLVGGTYRKRISMDASFDPVWFFSATYICGVHISFAQSGISNATSLDCFYVDGYQLIGNALNPHCTAGIDELPEQEISIYPNPSDGNFYVESDGLEPILEIHLLDLTGKRIATFEKNNVTNGLDISSFPSGMYLIEVVFEKGKSRSSLIKE